jgi:hypothetical protein
MVTTQSPSSGKIFVLAVFIIGASFFVTYLQEHDANNVGKVIYESRTPPRQEIYNPSLSQSSPPLPSLLPSCCLLGSSLEVPVPGNSCLVQIYNCNNADPACDGQDVTYTGYAQPPIVVGGRTIQPPAAQLTVPIPPGQGGHFSKGAKKHICVQQEE